MNYYCSRLALLLLSSFGVLSSLCSASGQELLTINASTNLLAGIVARAGQADVNPQTNLRWPVVAGEPVTNTVQGTNIAIWTAQAGHHYTATIDHFGQFSLSDSTAYDVSYFWYGFTFTFCILLSTWPVAWVRKMLGDDYSSEV